MPLKLEPECQQALDLAKRSVPTGAELDLLTLLGALYYSTNLQSRYPFLAAILTLPREVHPETPAKVNLSTPLKPIFKRLAQDPDTVTVDELFLALLNDEQSQQTLQAQGLAAELIAQVCREIAQLVYSWRQSPRRQEAIGALSSYGRMLTTQELPGGQVVGQEKIIQAIIRTLRRMTRRNAILVGYPGTGKSAIIYELARRIYTGDLSIPKQIRDMDIFELSPTFLRSGASLVGQYDERVKQLIELLRTYPQIILFVDEMHSFFQSSIYERGPFSDANESFKSVLGLGEITCLGCTTPSEYKHFIEPDKALARRFTIIRLDPPSRKVTLDILKAQSRKMEEYYSPLKIPAPLLDKVIDLTEAYLPARYQPDKSLQLLDEACAACAVSDPPLPEVTEAVLYQVLEDIAGHGLIRPEGLTWDKVYEELRQVIFGQDSVLREIAQAFVAGFSDWVKGRGPRGVFLFGGPTGVGKTETALVLARLLGGGQERLIRIDCNTLPAGHDRGPVTNLLLGVPPGYIGFARGQGGLLSRIREEPDAIVLFDEIEKAGPVVGELVLQIIDHGRIEDVEGNVLDFHRAFIIFTTNAGSEYAQSAIGFGGNQSAAAFIPRIEQGNLFRELKEAGLTEEFLARLSHVFLFQGLDPETVKVIVTKHLAKFQEEANRRQLTFTWEEELVDYLARQWQPRFGIRYLLTTLRHRLGEQLGVAEAQGELKSLTTIHLQRLPAGLSDQCQGLTAAVGRERQGETLNIFLA